MLRLSLVKVRFKRIYRSMDDNRSFDRHEAKSDQCMRERGFNFAFAIQVFAGPIFEREDARRDYGEKRMQAVGAINGERFMVVYTQREAVTWVISARRMHLKEWNKWHREL